MEELCFDSAGTDNKIFIWNISTGEVVTEIDTPDVPLSASWNWDGSLFVASTKDKKFRIFDPRTGAIKQVNFYQKILSLSFNVHFCY